MNGRYQLQNHLPGGVDEFPQFESLSTMFYEMFYYLDLQKMTSLLEQFQQGTLTMASRSVKLN